MDVAELVPQVPLGQRRRVGRLEEGTAGDGLEPFHETRVSAIGSRDERVIERFAAGARIGVAENLKVNDVIRPDIRRHECDCRQDRTRRRRQLRGLVHALRVCGRRNCATW